MAMANSEEVDSDSNPIRIVLWSPPRSLSTAFERCVSALKRKYPVTIFHEPFTTAYHLGPEKQISRPNSLSSLLVRENDYSYSWVQQQLEADFRGQKLVFFKDLGYAIDGKYDHIPAGYRHTFLIRDPKLVFTSMSNLLLKFPVTLWRIKMRKIFPKGWVYKEMFDLYEHLTETLGEKVTIIDAEDLIADPLAMLELYCGQCGMPFSEDMVTWRTEREDMKDWIYSKKMMRVNGVIGQYDRAMSSPGLGRPSERTVDVSKYPEECQEAVAFSEPFYRKLYDKRLRPPEKDS